VCESLAAHDVGGKVRGDHDDEEEAEPGAGGAEVGDGLGGLVERNLTGENLAHRRLSEKRITEIAH
jgi:hypothetical protein